MALSTTRTVLACSSAGLNAVLGGSVFIFGILAEPLGTSFHFSQAQLSTIALAGIAGQYPLAMVVGKFLDTRGPRPCSALAGVLFGVSLAWCSWEVHVSPGTEGRSNEAVFIRMVLAFLVAGIATVLSYFSAIFSASIALPSNPGIAFGLYMSLFGLSPLFLSLFPPLFTKDSEIQLSPLFAFLSIVLFCSHMIGAFLLPPKPSQKEPSPPPPQDLETNETSPLLPSAEDATSGEILHQSASVLLRDYAFWILFIYSLLTLGSCEMIMANIGTIVYSLPSSTHSNNVASTQIGITSISNTVSRLIAGPLLDFIFRGRCPSGKVAFLTFGAIILTIGSLLMIIGNRPQTNEEIWPLSLVTGVAYGTIFTTLPVLLQQQYSKHDLGRNFGLLTASPFFGTPLFSFIYAYISDQHNHPQADGEKQSLCYGRTCWLDTFRIMTVTSIVSIALSVILWKKWRRST